jgi:hypothetical protein
MKSATVILSILMVFTVKLCLGADASICNPGSTISYYPNGELKSCALKDTTVIGGVKCNMYAQVYFYELGMLKGCTTRDFYSYEGITCNEYGEISFYPSGKLDTCILSADAVVQGKSCVAQDPISFFENGKLRSCGTPRLATQPSDAPSPAASRSRPRVSAPDPPTVGPGAG